MTGLSSSRPALYRQSLFNCAISYYYVRNALIDPRLNQEVSFSQPSHLPMYPRELLCVVILAVLLSGLSAYTALTAPPRYDHVVIVVEENRTPGQIVGDTANAPFITSLATGGVSLATMFAIEHPSQPNYLQLFSGSNQGVVDDDLQSNFSLT